MKKKTLFALVLFPFLSTFGQRDYIPTPDDVIRFYKTTTLVVLDQNPMAEFNLIATDVMKNDWNLTPYDFISYSDFETKRMDGKYSFLMINQVRFDKDKTGTKYNFLSLLLGGNEKIVSNMPDLFPFPLSYAGVDEDTYSYKIAVVLRFMQNHVEFIKTHPDLIKENVFKHYNDNMGEIHDKILYLLPEELNKDVNTEGKIKKVYPYKFKLVSKEEIEQAIKDRDTNVVFLDKVGPEGTKIDARVYKIIMGVADSKIYFWDYHKLDEEKHPNAFLMSDFEKLAKSKKKRNKD